MRKITIIKAKTNKPNIIIPAASSFSQKMMEKHQNPKRKSFGFPAMIFYKHAGYIFPNLYKIHLNVPLHLDIVFSKIANIQTIQRLFTLPKKEERISKFLLKQTPVKIIQSLQEIFSQKTLSWIHRERGSESVSHFISSGQKISAISLGNRIFYRAAKIMERHHELKYRSLLEKLSATLLLQKSFFKTTNIKRTHEPTLLLSQINNFLGNRLFENKKEVIDLNSENFVYPASFSSLYKAANNRAGPGLAKAGYVYKPDSEALHFHKQRKIEEVVEEVKKIVAKSQEVMTEKFSYLNRDEHIDINRALDMNWLTDQVYQNIERRIRSERERRGL